jgi:iron only hydrogenase large subunit-like protein
MFCLGIDVSKKSCPYLINNAQEAFQNLLELLKSLSSPMQNLLLGLRATL